MQGRKIALLGLVCGAIGYRLGYAEGDVHGWWRREKSLGLLWPVAGLKESATSKPGVVGGRPLPGD